MVGNDGDTGSFASGADGFVDSEASLFDNGAGLVGFGFEEVEEAGEHDRDGAGRGAVLVCVLIHPAVDTPDFSATDTEGVVFEVHIVVIPGEGKCFAGS